MSTPELFLPPSCNFMMKIVFVFIFVFVFVLFSIAVLSPNIELECDEYAAAADKCEWELHQIGKCRGTISLVALIKTSTWGSDEIRRRWFREKEAEHSFCKNRKQNHRGQGSILSFSFVVRKNYGFLQLLLQTFIWGWIAETPFQFFRCSAFSLN